jgi:hypothetical protein
MSQPKFIRMSFAKTNNQNTSKVINAQITCLLW